MHARYVFIMVSHFFLSIKQYRFPEEYVMVYACIYELPFLRLRDKPYCSVSLYSYFSDFHSIEFIQMVYGSYAFSHLFHSLLLLTF